MTTQEIISKFELYVDDTTELSSDEEVALADKIYRSILTDRPWEFLKKTVTGSLSTSLPYIALPADFSYIYENANYTDNTVSYQGNAAPRVVYIGASYSPYQIINWSDRRKYINSNGYAYVDLPNSRLYFTKQPSVAETYEFDYIYTPATLTLTTSPVFPAQFHDIIYHGMASDDYIIQQFDKAKSYADENKKEFTNWLSKLALWNSKFYNG